MSSRFRFRLQPVLDHRGRIVDERQRDLALKQRERSDAQAIGAALDADREAHRASLMRDHESFDVDRLRATYTYLAALDRAIDDHAIRLAACEAEVVTAQAKLLEANTDRKVLETLKTRRYEAFVADAALLEQRDGDDQNARRHGRAQNQGGSER